MKCKLSQLGIQLHLPYPFPTMITIIPRASKSTIIHIYIYIYIYIYIFLSKVVYWINFIYNELKNNKTNPKFRFKDHFKSYLSKCRWRRLRICQLKQNELTAHRSFGKNKISRFNMLSHFLQHSIHRGKPPPPLVIISNMSALYAKDLVTC